MDTISIGKASHEFWKPEEQETLFVNGNPIHEILISLLPKRRHQEVDGLGPAISWCDDVYELEVTRSRIFNVLDRHQITTPLLVCPDDCDLFCGLIVVDAAFDQHSVTWQRVGMDVTETVHAQYRCRDINWWDIEFKFKFRHCEYFETMDALFKSNPIHSAWKEDYGDKQC